MTAASEGLELAFQPLEALDVEMVRRLVEEQEVGLDGERTSERGPGQLSSGERLELPIEIGIAEPEPPHGAGRPLAPRPATRVLESRLRVGIASKRALVVRSALHVLLEPPELVLEREQVARAGQDVLAQREAELARRTLVVQGHASSLRKGQLASLE